MIRIIEERHDEAHRLPTEHRRKLDALAKAPMEREAFDEEEILEVTGPPPAPPLANSKIVPTNSKIVPILGADSRV